MTQYRLYCINDHGSFSKAYEIVASDDGEALAKAQAMKSPVECELWSGDRLVAKLPVSSTVVGF